MFTPMQVSEMLNIPPSTLRRLSVEFADMLSKQRSRKRRYSEGDIALLRRVREMTGHKMSIEEIRQALPIVEKTPERAEEVGDTLALIPGVSTELSRLDTAFHEVLSELEKMRQAQEASAERLARLEELERWVSLPWWKRLFSRPGKGGS